MFLWRGKAPHPHTHALAGSEAEISSRLRANAIRYYPGDAVLQAYLKGAIQSGLISLPTFTATFLLAARSRALREPTTLSLLCKTIQDAPSWFDPSAAPATLLPEDPDLALGTVRDALELLKATYDPMLPAHHFQRVVGPVGNLSLSLINPTPNFANASGTLALDCIQSIRDLLLHAFALDQNLRQPLENLALSLSLFLGENDGSTSRGSMSNTRSSFGQVDILGPGLENDITTCSLLLFHLIIDRAKAYGSGHETHATALLVATFRTTAWSLQRFFTQLFQSAVACLSMDLSHVTNKRSPSLWNAFIAGRLPRLLASFERALVMDGIPTTEYRAALREAWATLCLGDPLSSSLAHYENMWSLVGANHSLENTDKLAVSFTRAFTYQLLSSGLLDQAFAVRIDPGLTGESPSRLQAEAREAGTDLGTYLNQRFSTDLTANDAQVLLQRVYSDPISHAAFAETVYKRFDIASSNGDVETLGHISRILSANETAMDLVSLHVELSSLVSSALAVAEEYDCEAVGDPQSAVGNLGDIVLFVQLATARFKVSGILKYKSRAVDMSYLGRADAILMPPAFTGEEARAFKTWFKALFDKNSEGIEDGVLRSTRPKTLLAIVATVFLSAVRAAAERKLDLDVLNNGISYFLGPLLGWTLPGIVLALVREIRLTRFQSPQHLNVLRVLLLSPKLPRPVLSLCGPSVVRLLSEVQGVSQPFDVAALRLEVIKVMGVTVAEPIPTSSLRWADQPRRAVQNALALIQSGKAPFLHVTACLVETSTTDFLQTFWSELNVSIKTGVMADAARRLAVFVLATPRVPRTPPLMPIFLHNVLPSLLDEFDNPKLGQTIPGDLELLIAIISSSLMAALQLERALYITSGEQVYPLGSSSSSMARRLALDLRHRKISSKGKLIAQRLTSSQAFVTSFPIFKTEI
ncbi:hypothetical protein B0F90DRAFT_1813191 [Multifurca ochricompacta]|uniref:Mediator of RNA polymerase II transcription subunit 5 n=1 Tax=Multifurca ochricompacta TaxID=376703 RepID=A0AAD4QQB9_9AGAM|nr:hypothetical protein B0F90DRAFT_1813191 [Multifurca ochricompacta]